MKIHNLLARWHRRGYSLLRPDDSCREFDYQVECAGKAAYGPLDVLLTLTENDTPMRIQLSPDEAEDLSQRLISMARTTRAMITARTKALDTAPDSK